MIQYTVPQYFTGNFNEFNFHCFRKLLHKTYARKISVYTWSYLSRLILHIPFGLVFPPAPTPSGLEGLGPITR